MNMKPYGNEIFSNNQRYADVFCRGVFFFDSRLPKEPKKRNRKWRRRLGTSEVDHGSLAGLSGG